MFKKSVIVKGFLCSFIAAALLSGCSRNVAEPPATNTVQSDSATGAAALPDEPKMASSAAQPEESETATNSTIYEGLYFDESYYHYIDMPQEESPLIYCEITINNVTDTSFDFIIHEKVMATGETKILVPANTAIITKETSGASKAVYQGENLTLTFVFPDDENTFPQHLEVSGLEQLESKVYINNTIPGHESG